VAELQQRAATLSGQKSACTKFHQIRNDNRCCVYEYRVNSRITGDTEVIVSAMWMNGWLCVHVAQEISKRRFHRPLFGTADVERLLTRQVSPPERLFVKAVGFRPTTLSCVTLNGMRGIRCALIVVMFFRPFYWPSGLFRVSRGLKTRNFYFAGLCAWLLRGPRRGVARKTVPPIPELAMGAS
jgi:hypothetical protein